MSDHAIRSPAPSQISAMDADTLSRRAEAEAVRNSVRALGRNVYSPKQNISTASYPTGSQVRRKPVGIDGLWRNVHDDWNSLEDGPEQPNLRAYEQYSEHMPPPVPNMSPRRRTVESQPQINGYTYFDGVSNIGNQREMPEQEYIYTGYDYYGQNIEDHNVNISGDPYANSSTTINSANPMLPKPPTEIPFPRPLSCSIIAPPPPHPSTTTIRKALLLITICASMFLTQAALSASIAPLPYITSTFTTLTHQPSPSWYSAAYSLTVGTFILPAGRLGDVYGPKRIFVIGWIWFTMASLGAGFNPRLTDADNTGSGEVFFCFCRAMQGIGPALLMPNGLAILGRSYEGEEKNMAFALFGASAPVGFVLGSVMSSLLAERSHWTWAFWGLAVACAVLGVVSAGVVPQFPGSADTPPSFAGGGEPVEGEVDMSMWRRLDIPGTILGVVGLVLVNVALNQAPIVSWSTPYTYFILVIGLIILSVFFFVEFIPYLTPHPLIPLTILSLDTCFVLACIACGWATFGIWIFYLWEFLETLRGLSPLLASAQFSPAALSGLCAALTTGFLLSKTTPQVIMVLSMLAFFVGTTLIATAPVDQTYWGQALFSIIIMPWGMDMSFPSATILLSGKVGPEHQGVAMSLVNTIVNYSISVGLGLAGTVQSNVDKDGTQFLTGIRSAWYFGMGLSGTGIMVAVTFLVVTTWRARKSTLREKGDFGNA